MRNIGGELEQLCQRFSAEDNSVAKSSAQINQDEQFEVAEILAWRRHGSGHREFLVRWEDYPPSNDEWVPEYNMSCVALLESFIAKNPEESLEKDGDDNHQDDENITDGKSGDQAEAFHPLITRTLVCIVCQNEFPIQLAANMPRMRAFVCSKECALQNADDEEE